MADALILSLLHRILHTPLRDVVRGRLSGRLDVNRRIATCGLPAPAQAVIQNVVRRTRLWRLEKVDVADGLESGATVDALIAAFGDQGKAARLIRWAKQRGRPVVWHVWRGLVLLAMALFVYCIVATVQFYAGSPSPSVNYVTVLNREVQQIPEDQRAWPLYREAMLALGATVAGQYRFHELAQVMAGEARWDEKVTWLGEHQDALSIVRRASQRQALGFVLGPGGSQDDVQLWPNLTGDGPRLHIDAKVPGADTIGDPVITVVIPYVNELLILGNLLADDASVSRERGDARRLLGDVEAMLGMARQLAQADGFIYTDFIGISVATKALNQIEQTLVERPELLQNPDLQRLAHMLARPDTAATLVRLDRVAFRDAIQRLYTDDGHGSGRLTPDGLKLLPYVGAIAGSREFGPDIRMIATLGPVAMMLSASRQEVLAEYERLTALGDANLRKTLRQADWTPVDQQLQRWRDSIIGRIRYAPILILMQSGHAAHLRAERYLAQRDGLLVGIALKHYHRQRTHYPQTLDALVPDLLPAIPADRITGDPLRYRLIDGRPLIYSVGSDRDDDGGRVPRLSHIEDYRDPSIPPEAAADGDWVLYPAPLVSRPGAWWQPAED